MNASYEWLRELVPSPLSPAEMGDLLTAHCASVDEVVRLRADLDAIVVARVASAGRHPNSDHLWVTKVDAGGGELLDVVCGAPNVKEGALYPFASVGTTLPGGITLERRKIRGELSNGMLCSARELGLGEDHAGIMELDVNVPPGTKFLDAVPIGDSRIVVDVTPNRPDLLSHIGLARELAAATGVKVQYPDDAISGWREPARSAKEGITGGTTVTLQDAGGCTRYAGAVIKGVVVRESPDWLKRRLEAVGSRSVNNIVDATNYVLQESGQPLHAFDLDTLGGAAVVIRKAKDKETLVTLDGVSRTLNPSMTVIADATRAQAIAGVMGGLDSAVTDKTRNVFLEIATFDPARIRSARLALGLSTDASYRFERGVDPELPGSVMRRAVKLIIELAGGELAGAPVDVYPAPRTRGTVVLRTSRVSTVLGEIIPASEIVRILQSVGFEPATSGGAASGTVNVTVPSWRVDVAAEVDLIEEIARLRGYSSFPDGIRAYRPGNVPSDYVHQLSRRLRNLLAGEGVFEARPLPFVRGEDATHVRIVNPISEDERHLRRSIMETLARRVEYNLAQMQRNVRLFEIGTVFIPKNGERAVEEINVGAVLLGDRFPAHFTAPKPPHFDEWDAKGLAESLAREIYPGAACELVPVAGSDGVLWSVTAGAAIVGEVRRLSLDAPVWAAPAFGVEIRVARVDAAPVAPQGRNAYAGTPGATPVRSQVNKARRFRAIPTQPAADFDLALLVPDSLTAATVEAAIRKAGGELLEAVELFDEFRGKGLPPATRSLAWRLTFRHQERTLRDKEVEGRRQKLLAVLEKELGVRQRTT